MYLYNLGSISPLSLFFQGSYGPSPTLSERSKVVSKFKSFKKKKKKMALRAILARGQFWEMIPTLEVISA